MKDREEFAAFLEAETTEYVDAGCPPIPVISGLLNINKEVQEIIPLSLYRICACEDRKFSELREGKVFYPSPNMFNDPFDTLPYFDLDEILKNVDQDLTIENMEKHLEWQKRFLHQDHYEAIKKSVLTNFEEGKAAFMLDIETKFSDLVREFQKSTSCLCLTETLSSPTMWAHYANNGTGFGVEYHIDNQKIECCCDEPSCEGRIFSSLLPVIYSSERFDCSPLAHTVFDRGNNPLPLLKPYLFMLNCSLYKDLDWQYEKEWRLLSQPCGGEGGNKWLLLQPAAIYIGTDTSISDSEELIKIATEKSIPIYQMEVDWGSSHSCLRAIEL